MREGPTSLGGRPKKGAKYVEHPMILSQGTAYVLAVLKGGESPPICFFSAEVDEMMKFDRKYK